MHRPFKQLNLYGDAGRGRGGDGGRGRGDHGRGRGGRGGMRHPVQPIVENPDVVVNAWKLDVDKNFSVYKYDVSIVLHEESRRFRKEIQGLFQYRDKTVKIVNYAFSLRPQVPFEYDRAAALYSIDKNLSHTITVRGTDIPESDIGDCNVTVTIAASERFQTSTNDLAACVKAVGYQPNLLEWLNIVVEKQAYTRPDKWYSERGTHYLQDKKDAREFPGGVLLKPGIRTSVKVYGNEMNKLHLALVADIKIGMFHRQQPLHEKYNDLAKMGLPKAIIETLIRRISVETTYAGRKQVFSIQGLRRGAHEEFFVLRADDGNERRISVFDFFRDQKGITLQYPSLPVVCKATAKGISFFPMELLQVLPNQSVRSEQTIGEVQDEAIKMSAMLPQVRLDMIRKYKMLLDLMPDNQQLLDSGVHVSDDITQIKAKTLHYVRVHTNMELSNNVSWSVHRFYAPPRLEKWAIIKMGEVQKFEEFSTFLQERMIQKGFQLSKPTLVTGTINMSAKAILERAQSQFTYVIIVMDDRVLDHDELKFSEISSEVVTQIVKGSNAEDIVRNRLNATADNILLKACIKNGGVPYEIESGSILLKINSNETMYMGLEFGQQAPKSGARVSHQGGRKVPARVGFAATCGNDPRKIIGDYKFMAPGNNEAVFGQLTEITNRCLKAFKANRKTMPQKIVIFISGFPEGQWSKVKESLKNSVKKVFHGRIILIAVSQRPLERVFKKNIQGRNSREQNVNAGLLIDTEIVAPTADEFFLNPHQILQGTARTPKYKILLNEANVPNRDIQLATHALCCLHGVCTSAVALPAVLTVADRCADRGHSNLRYYVNNIGFKTDDMVEEANKEITNDPNGRLATLRYNP